MKIINIKLHFLDILTEFIEFSSFILPGFPAGF